MVQNNPVVRECVDASAPPVLGSDERAVLETLGGVGEDYCFAFAYISAGTGLERKDVRAACRSLAAKGLARYERGLWTEDGDMAGSGYGLTIAGRHHYWNDPSFGGASLRVHTQTEDEGPVLNNNKPDRTL